MARTEVLDDPAIVAVEDVAEALGTDLRAGLTSAEASRRLGEDGPNQLRAAPPVPTWRKILAQFQDPLIYLCSLRLSSPGCLGDRDGRVGRWMHW